VGLAFDAEGKKEKGGEMERRRGGEGDEAGRLLVLFCSGVRVKQPISREIGRLSFAGRLPVQMNARARCWSFLTNGGESFARSAFRRGRRRFYEGAWSATEGQQLFFLGTLTKHPKLRKQGFRY